MASLRPDVRRVFRQAIAVWLTNNNDCGAQASSDNESSFVVTGARLIPRD
jgi:hypothetical protein